MVAICCSIWLRRSVAGQYPRARRNMASALVWHCLQDCSSSQPGMTWATLGCFVDPGSQLLVRRSEPWGLANKPATHLVPRTGSSKYFAFRLAAYSTGTALILLHLEIKTLALVKPIAPTPFL